MNESSSARSSRLKGHVALVIGGRSGIGRAIAQTLASGRADALSGRFLSIYDDLGHLLKNSAQIEKQNLHALKVERLPGAQPNPALASILAEARTAAK